MEKIIFFLAILLVLGFIVWLITRFVYQRKIVRTIEQLHNMIDEAQRGTYKESIYDESKQSALESKLRRYLTESGSTKEQLSAERDQIKMLISDIAHQTKTPISNIILYGQLIEENGKIPADVKEGIIYINKQSEKLRFLVDALVKASRLETGIISINQTVQPVLPMLQAILAEVQPLLEAKDLQVRLICEDEIAMFDQKWTSEAIYNVVENAIKYSSVDGVIEVIVRNYERFCKIDVKDSGIGIVEQEINQIFKRFYRSPEVVKHEGVGIGLYLSREIIAAQNGYIKVKSSLGEGSTFSIVLPKD